MPRNLTEKTEADTRKKTEAAEAFATEGHGISRKKQKQIHGRKNKTKIPCKVNQGCGCITKKVAHGAVAVGLPHRNRSVFKQAQKKMTHPTEWMGLKAGKE